MEKIIEIIYSNCKLCNREFEKKIHNQQYCSEKCQKFAKAKRSNETKTKRKKGYKNPQNINKICLFL